MQEPTAASATMKVIVFQLKDKEYAIPVQQVIAFEKMLPITRVPHTPEYMKGVINLRGLIIPIIDLRVRFGLEEQEESSSTRIIIVSLNGMEVGLVVDAANDVTDIPQDSVEPQPEVVGAVKTEFISGVAKIGNRLLILLNLEKVLNPND